MKGIVSPCACGNDGFRERAALPGAAAQAART